MASASTDSAGAESARMVVTDAERILRLARGSDADRVDLERHLLELDARGWLRLDDGVRKSTWRDRHLAGTTGVPTLEGEPMLELALRTMSASGHVREAAIHSLAAQSASVLAPFLALRTSDWVPEVAGLARIELGRRVALDDAATALALPVVLALAGRTRAGGMAEELASRITVDRPELLELLLASPDRATRQLAVREGLGRDLLALDRLIHLAVHDRDTRVAVDAGVAAVGRAVASGDRPAVTRLLAGRAPVRLAVLDASPNDAEGIALAEGLLFDRSPLVRTGARSVLARAEVDVLARYREALTEQGRRAIAISELGRNRAPYAGLRARPTDDTIADAGLVRPYLADASPTVRAAAVRSLHALAWDRSVEAILPLLEDPAPPVVRATAEMLMLHPSQVDLRFLVELFGPGRPVHVRFAAIKLIRHRSAMARLLVDLRTVREPDGPVRAGAIDDLRTWLARDAASQPRPSLADRRQLADELEASRESLPQGWDAQIAFHLGLRTVDLDR